MNTADQSLAYALSKLYTAKELQNMPLEQAVQLRAMFYTGLVCERTYDNCKGLDAFMAECERADHKELQENATQVVGAAWLVAKDDERMKN